MISPRAAADRWARTWAAGWEALDPEPIVALYAESAVFSSGPFREPLVGRDGVRSYVTRVFAEERAPRVRMAEPIVEGDRAAISWWASMSEEGVELTLAGTSVLRFDSDGLVIEQWDAWNQAAGRRDAPSTPSPFVDRDSQGVATG